MKVTGNRIKGTLHNPEGIPRSSRGMTLLL
jgi:hypothetical protein